MLYNDKQRKEAEELVHRMVKRAVEMEGTVTGEHGVGLVKRDYLNHELGETTVDAMRKVSSCLNLFQFKLTWNSSSWHSTLYVY
jgi:FAD/FMN-containing dehydrogenase